MQMPIKADRIITSSEAPVLENHHEWDHPFNGWVTTIDPTNP